MPRTGRPKSELVLSAEEREQVTRWSRRAKSSQALALRSKIVLACAEGHDTKTVAEQLGCARVTVGKWRARFVEHRLDGLTDEQGTGRPATITIDQVEDVAVATLESTPPSSTHWSRVKMAQRTGLSKTTIGRSGRSSSSSPTELITSSSPTTRCSSTSSTTLSASTSTHPTPQSCCAWTRSPRSRPCNAPSRRSR